MVELDAPELELVSLLAAELELGCEAELPGCALELLELESLLGALAPPEAEPDLDVSVLDDEELGGVTDVLDEDEPGVEGVDDAPPVPPTDAEPEVEPGAVEGDEGVVRAVLLVLEPGADEVLALSSRLHAARPKASATATAIAESFIFPPWLGYKGAAKCAPGLSP